MVEFYAFSQGLLIEPPSSYLVHDIKYVVEGIKIYSLCLEHCSALCI